MSSGRRKSRLAPGKTRQGVRDLNSNEWKLYESSSKKVEPLVSKSIKTSLTEEVPLIEIDLLYCSLYEDIRKKIQSQFPAVEFVPHWDYIREHRTEVVFGGNGVPSVEWYKFLLRNRLTNFSINFQLSIYENPALVKTALAAIERDEQ